MTVHEAVKVKHNGGFQTINLTVAPLALHGMPEGLLMVVFQEIGPTAGDAEVKPSASGRKQVARLEEELRLTRENLQSAIEELEATNQELKSANEELQSNNEELQSSNEELDTSREELQSLNEELLTVNAELSAKTDMLTKANDDLKNYLSRTDIAIIFLDEEIKIRSYTPATEEVFSIRQIDIGRPLGEISTRLTYESLVDNAREVLRTLTPKEIEVQRKDGHWYEMRILPFLTTQNAVDGLVVSFLDIDKQKHAVGELSAANQELNKALQRVRESEERYGSLFRNMTEGFALVEILHDREGKPYDVRYLDVNPAWEKIMGLGRDKVLGKTHREINPGLDLVSAEFFSRLVANEVPDIFEYYSTFLSRWLEVNVNFPEKGRAAYIIRDITERKNVDQIKEDFVGMVSHEMRTPLTVIIGAIDTAMSKGISQEDARQLLNDAMESAAGLSNILENLLELSRFQSNRLVIKKSPFLSSQPWYVLGRQNSCK